MDQGWTPAPSHADGGGSPRRRAGRRRGTAALVLLCLVSLWVRFRTIESAMPYPWDIDEGYVSGPAIRIVQTGTWHPYTFNYPSLPKYLAAVGMGAGFLRGASRLEIREVRQIGNVGYPYYETPRVMQTARQLFAVLSVVMLSATGIAAWYAFEVPLLIVLAPLVLSMSELFFYHSWTYLNVDIVSACFATLTMAAVLRGSRSPSLARSAIVPGLFAGLATGGKYTLAVVIVPVLLGIVLRPGAGRRMWASVAAIAAMLAAFLVVTPYSLLDIPGFLNGVASEAFHYTRGHNGSDGPPGMPQLVYYLEHFRAEFGLVGLGVAVAGAFAFTVADWRRATILLSLPIAVLSLLFPQRAHFTRNALSLHPIVAMWLAYGIVRVHAWVTPLVARRGWHTPRIRPRVGAVVGPVVGLLLLVAAVPLWRVRDQFRDHTDSRNVAVEFIETRIPKDWAIVVPTELGVDVRPLQAKGTQVTVMNLQSATDATALQRAVAGVARPAIILLPHWGADPRSPGQDTANALNNASHLWQVMRSFGTGLVLVNYTSPTPSGDPAFDIAVIDRPRQ